MTRTGGRMRRGRGASAAEPSDTPRPGTGRTDVRSWHIVPAQVLGVAAWAALFLGAGPVTEEIGGVAGDLLGSFVGLVTGAAVAAVVVLAVPVRVIRTGFRWLFAATGPVLAVAGVLTMAFSSWTLTPHTAELVGLLALTGIAGTLAAGLARPGRTGS